jgi:hypothetical protein
MILPETRNLREQRFVSKAVADETGLNPRHTSASERQNHEHVGKTVSIRKTEWTNRKK